DGSGRVVGVADVDESGARIGGDHGLHVVTVSRRERHLGDFGVGGVCGPHARLVRRIGGDVTAGRRSEREDRVGERLTGTGVYGNVVGWHVELLRSGLGQMVDYAVRVIASTRGCGGRDG